MLIYSGQDDVIVPTPGTRSWVYNLKWKYIKQFELSQSVPYYNPNNEVIGTRMKFRNLHFAIVNKAGHEVPHYQP